MAVELVQQMAREEVEYKAAEERLRKKAVAAKRKEKVITPSDQPVADIREDIYIAAFHVGSPFDILCWPNWRYGGARDSRLDLKN